jgi:hypothetical protein
MGRKVAIFWHATFSIAAGVLYFFFVLPRWPELMGDTSHTLGTVARIAAGVVIALAALPVMFTLLRVRKPEYGTPQLALTLQTSSVVAHVLAGVLIVGTAISEIWLNLDNVGQWLFGVYGAAAAIAVLGIFGFYLSFIAELPPPPPKPLKPKKEKQRRRSAGRKKDGEADETEAEAEEVEADGEAGEAAEADGDETTETPEETDQPAEVTAETDVESTAVEPESTTPEAPAVEDAEAGEDSEEEDDADSSARGLRNRRPTGKSSGVHRRRRTRRGVAVED